MGNRGFTTVAGPSRCQSEICSERNLAFAILRQAWREAILDMDGVRESSRSDYSLLKEKAINWISSDNQGFLYWCQLADVNYSEVRKRLHEALRLQQQPG
jgi:hypothetical protein